MKFEIRSTKFETSTKYEMVIFKREFVWSIRHSDFEFVSCFVLRICALPSAYGEAA